MVGEPNVYNYGMTKYNLYIGQTIGQSFHTFQVEYTSMGICIDFKKAFDTVSHPKSLKKLNNYGLRGVCLKFFESYLMNKE